MFGKQESCNARPFQVYFNAMVTPVACFGAAHRKVYKQDLCKMANYVSNLPGERWVVRALNWVPENARRVGRPAYTWDSMTQRNQLGNWRERAQDAFHWMILLDEFILAVFIIVEKVV